jgi:uncharacterized protein (DUF488 family)
METEEQKTLFAPSYYTIGYESLSTSQFFEMMRQHRIRAVVDIRAKPFSYREEWNKINLKMATEARGMSYIHMEELGNPYKDEKVWREKYRAHLAQRGLDRILGELKKLTAPICILCYCGDVRECHRGVLTQELSRMGYTGMHLQARGKF